MVYIYLPVAYYHLNLDVTKANLLAVGFSAVPGVFLVLFHFMIWLRHHLWVCSKLIYEVVLFLRYTTLKMHFGYYWGMAFILRWP